MKTNSKKNSKQAKPVTKVTNRKEYAQIAAPVAYSQKQEFPDHSKMRSRRIVNSEFVSTIAGSTSFSSTQKFVINPGLVATFPWLSVLAAEWQQYRIHKMCFRFVTRTSTSSVGSVILSPDYNAVDNAPATEQIASNTQDAVEDVCWRSITCHLDVAAMFPFGPRKQIRIGNINGDYTTYDAGRLFVCVTGQSSAADIGKLWVDYDVELFVPQSSPAQNVTTGATQTSCFTLSADQSFSTGVLTKLAYDASLVNSLNVVNAAGVFTPPAGNYILISTLYFSSTSCGAYSGTISTYKNGVLDRSLGDLAQTFSAGVLKFSSNGTTYVSANGTDTFEIRFNLGMVGTLSILTESTLLWILA